jgi:hypothetical protein
VQEQPQGSPIQPEQLTDVKRLGEGAFAFVDLCWYRPEDGSTPSMVRATCGLCGAVVLFSNCGMLEACYVGLAACFVGVQLDWCGCAGLLAAAQEAC